MLGTAICTPAGAGLKPGQICHKGSETLKVLFHEIINDLHQIET